MLQRTLFHDAPSFVGRRTKAVTFQGKMGLPVHRWYRLTPSFSPHLAWDIAKNFGLTDADFVLDPFSGVGTVPLCMKYIGIPACSVELNPYLHFVGTVKTRDYDDMDAIETTFRRFAEGLRAELAALPSDVRRYLNDHEQDVPRISNPERWWSCGNLAQLVCLRRYLKGFAGNAFHKDLLKMAVLGVLIPVSNAKHNHVSLTFAEKPLDTIDIGAVVDEKLSEILADLRAVRTMPRADVIVYHGNSKALSSILPASATVSAVITSPPYPNRFSYARETRPHLFFFDFIDDAKSVGELETDAIGGTWGKATSVLAQGVEPANDLVEKVLAPFIGGVTAADKGSLMRSYVVKYFNNIFEHAAEIAKVCCSRAQLAYVIGNSKFYENPLPSDEILAAIFQHFGFMTVRIDKMRKRQSKAGLYEAVVFMQR